MLATVTSPRAWRVIAAFLIAPAVAAFVLAWTSPLFGGVTDKAERLVSSFRLYALGGAYPTTLLFGLPAYLLLRGRVRPTVLSCAIAGAAVAAAPWLLLTVLGAPEQASLNGYVTAVDGRRTAWGWLMEARFIAEIGSMGAIGGVVFWIVAAARLTSRPSDAV